MKLLITGSRGWKDADKVLEVIREHKERAEMRAEPFFLIHGHAKSGADAMADAAARRLGMIAGADLIRVPADWKRYGKAAGPIRNQKMLDDHEPDVVAAFRATGKSSGTDDMIQRAQRAGVHVDTHHA